MGIAGMMSSNFATTRETADKRDNDLSRLATTPAPANCKSMHEKRDNDIVSLVACLNASYLLLDIARTDVDPEIVNKRIKHAQIGIDNALTMIADTVECMERKKNIEEIQRLMEESCPIHTLTT